MNNRRAPPVPSTFNTAKPAAVVYHTPARRVAIARANQLRIAFIHPNLGIGGAERLVVDAAVGLQKRGHTVEIFTSYHEDGQHGKGSRSFEETRNGTLKVHVLGATFVPASIFGRFTIVCTILRQVHLTISFMLATLLYAMGQLPVLGVFVNAICSPFNPPFKSSSEWNMLRQLEPFDVIVMDQLSTTIPILRWLGNNRVVFYCHFPDLLLSPNRINPDAPQSFTSSVIGIYRRPIDLLEEASTGEADKILVNSEYTAQVFVDTFGQMRRMPRVVYPGIDVDEIVKGVTSKDDAWLINDQLTLLSINRFEGKKDVALAIEAFERARVKHPKLRLVIAGGYDAKLKENVMTLESLQQLADSLNLTHYTYSASAAVATTSSLIHATPPPTKSTSPSILFLLNFTTAQKHLLLNAKSTQMLLYTPSNEHFGIVPLEAMAAGLPVIAVSSGGPIETVYDPKYRALLDEDNVDESLMTGRLLVPAPDIWSAALLEMLALDKKRLREIGLAGQKRVREHFSLDKLAEGMERACRDAAQLKAPIWGEVGSIKFATFCGIGTFCMGTGMVVHWYSS